MGTLMVLAALAFHRCGEVDRSKTALGDWLVSSDFPTGKVYALSEEAVQAKKHVRDVDGVKSTVTLNTVRVTFCADVSRVNGASIKKHYDDYNRQEVGRGELERVGGSSGVELTHYLRRTCYELNPVTPRELQKRRNSRRVSQF